MAAWLLNLPTEAPALELLATVEGPGSTTGGKLPEAVRTALLGGDYDAGALRLEVSLSIGLTTVSLTDRITQLGETEIQLFGHHPTEPGELEAPTIEISLDNSDGEFTPGNPSGSIPVLDFGSATIQTRVREFITDPSGGSVLFSQDWALAEVTVAHEGEVIQANLLGVHPLGGWMAQRWRHEDSDRVDWNGYPHPAFD